MAPKTKTKTAITKKTKAANDSSNKYNTSTGKLNPNYKAPTVSTSTGTKVSSSGSESVKTLQRQLNAKGANLKVDGVMGPLTKAAQDKYGSVPMRNDTNYGAINPKPTYNTTPIPKASLFANPFAKGSGNFFKNVLGGAGIAGKGISNFFKDTISTSSGSDMSKALARTTATPVLAADEDPFAAVSSNPNPYQVNPDGTGQRINPDIKAKSPFEILSGAFTDTTKATAPTATAPTSYSADDSGSLALTPGEFGGASGESQYPKSGSSTMSSLDNPVEPASVLPPGEIAPVAGDMGTGAGVNGLGLTGAQQNGINQALMGMKDTATSPNPWDSKGTQSTAQEGTIVTYADNLARNFTSSEQATNWFNSPEGQGSTYVQKGGTLADLTAKVKPITTTVNGIQPAQTTPEYLAKAQASIEGERKIMNDMIASEANFTQQQKDILFGKKDANGNDILLGVAEQQKKENEERIAYYDRLEARFDKNEKEKTRLAIDKARAEFEMKDAETEIARVNAKNNLTEFLAKIGALRTDGNALLGIEKLEQSYQAQRQQLRQNFLFAEREIRQASEERMFNLETDLEDKKFKLSQDLSKTEREVMMDGMKLDYDFNKTLNNLKLKWSDSIKSEREKAAQKAETAAAFNNAQWLSLVGQGIDPSMIPGMLDSKGKVIANEKNAQIIQGTYTEPVTLMQGPDGIQYNVPESQVQAFIKDGGRKL